MYLMYHSCVWLFVNISMVFYVMQLVEENNKASILDTTISLSIIKNAILITSNSKYYTISFGQQIE